MGRRRRGASWQVEVNSSKALEGFRRIVVQVRGTEAEAEALESLIRRNVLTYGKHPVSAADRPLYPALPHGTLRIATRLALKTHWLDLPSRGRVEGDIWPIISWLEDHGCPDFEQVMIPGVVNALIKWEREERGNTNATINQHLSYLETINTLARDHWLALTATTMPLLRLPLYRETWWLRPEALADLTDWLEGQGDSLFADLVRVIVLEGCSIEQALGLRPRHVTAIDGEEPWVKVDDAIIPVFDAAIPTFRRCLERAKRYRWDFLFPITRRGVNTQWNNCKQHLGIEGNEGATLRALRGSFARYAGLAGIQPGTLQGMLNRLGVPAHLGHISEAATGRCERVPRRRLNRPNGASMQSGVSQE